MGFAAKLKGFFGLAEPLSPELFEDLGDILVEGDFGAAAAQGLVDRLEAAAKREHIASPAELLERFVRLLEEGLLAADPDAQTAGALPVILLLGVNGVGKTTTAAKLASRALGRGRRPILAAADTFRAAAVDQIKIHGERLEVRVVAHRSGGDPAAVVYDAVEAALAGGGDLVIADTAGRMHTRAALVEELKKIDRVLETKLGSPGSPGEPGGASGLPSLPGASARSVKWLVLDATTGRNALAQAETFHEAVNLDGVILTKYDSGARGGIVFSLAAELKLPTVFLCDGEGYGHIRPFDPAAFARGFAGQGS